MRDFRIRPKSDYLHTANWEQLYLLTEHWKSNLSFYADEIRFMNSLVDKYFIWLLKNDDLKKVQTLSREILQLNDVVENLKKKVDQHLHHLSELKENAFSHDEQKFRDDHELIENDLVSFLKTFRDVKAKTFKVSKKVINNEKLQHLLTR